MSYPETALQPVDRTAATLLRKASWWARPPPEVKKRVEDKAAALSLEELTKVLMAPPEGVEDRRGCILHWADAARCEAVVVGYSHSVPRKHRNTHYWWILKDDAFVRMRWRKPSHRAWTCHTTRESLPQYTGAEIVDSMSSPVSVGAPGGWQMDGKTVQMCRDVMLCPFPPEVPGHMIVRKVNEHQFTLEEPQAECSTV